MEYLDAGAELSPSGVYRYLLWRRWESGSKPVVFIMLNPSTADSSIDDPTIRKCVGFAERWGHNGIIVLNLFAYRATKPIHLLNVGSRAVGSLNNLYLDRIVSYPDNVGKIVLAWGSHGGYLDRYRYVIRRLRNQELWCLGKLTANNHPRHPLMLSYDTPLVQYL